MNYEDLMLLKDLIAERRLAEATALIDAALSQQALFSPPDLGVHAVENMSSDETIGGK